MIETKDLILRQGSADDWQKRGIYTPKEMTLVSHDEYEEKWNRFCDDFIAGDGVE